MISTRRLSLLPLALIVTACASETDETSDHEVDTESSELSASPFDPTSCPGPHLTEKPLLALVPAGQTETPLGSLSLRVRSRTCSDGTGCTAWSAPTKANLTAQVDIRVIRDSATNRIRPMPVLDFDSCAGGDGVSCLAYADGSNPGTQLCAGFAPLRRRAGNECVGPISQTSRLYVADHCMRFTGFAKKTETRMQWTEYDYAGVGGF